MKCPKCHYLSFDPEPRCKNCGFDLEVIDPELELRHESPAAVVPELTLREQGRASAATVTLELAPPPRPAARVPRVAAKRPAVVDPVVDFEPLDDFQVPDESEPVHQLRTDAEFEPTSAAEAPIGWTPAPAPEPESPALAPIAATAFTEPVAPVEPVVPVEPASDLPLFVQGLSAREELPDEASPQLPDRGVAGGRPPLGVRRSTQEPARPRARQPERRLGPIDHDLLEDLARVEREEAAMARAADVRAFAAAVHELDARDRARPLDRLAAAAVDALVLGGIATFVFWATLRLCDVDLFGLGLALVPLVVFLALMDIGYLLMFTAAGGQTVGKMLMGIRVVADDDGDRISLRVAAWRAGLTVLSVVGFGVSWLPALAGRGEALHDRLVHTRVVRA